MHLAHIFPYHLCTDAETQIAKTQIELHVDAVMYAHQDLSQRQMDQELLLSKVGKESRVLEMLTLSQ